MWYKYINRNTEELRIWRNANLKFAQDDIGMMRHKHLGKFTETIFRMARSQGQLRGASAFFLIAGIMSVSYVKANVYDPIYAKQNEQKARKEEEQNNRKAADSLFYNRVGAPTRPNRTMEELMIFLMSAETINKAVQFISYDGASDMTHDQEKGLDGVLTQEDSKMMKYYVESLKFKADH